MQLKYVALVIWTSLACVLNLSVKYLLILFWVSLGTSVGNGGTQFFQITEIWLYLELIVRYFVLKIKQDSLYSS